jgi:hypothetical protein
MWFDQFLFFQWYTDDDTWWSGPVLLIKDQPIGPIYDIVYDTDSMPVTLLGSAIYSNILGNRANIMDYTKGAVDVP